MKLLIEIDEGDETALIALAESELRSKTAQAKKLLVEAIRRESENGVEVAAPIGKEAAQ